MAMGWGGKLKSEKNFFSSREDNAHNRKIVCFERRKEGLFGILRTFSRYVLNNLIGLLCLSVLVLVNIRGIRRSRQINYKKPIEIKKEGK